MDGEETYGKPVTVPVHGVAHHKCAQHDLISRRVFGSISLKDLNNKELNDLKELVLIEINDREGVNHEAELF